MMIVDQYCQSLFQTFFSKNVDKETLGKKTRRDRYACPFHLQQMVCVEIYHVVVKDVLNDMKQ